MNAMRCAKILAADAENKIEENTFFMLGRVGVGATLDMNFALHGNRRFVLKWQLSP